MPSQIQIKSFNQQLGDMIRSIIANTTLNDINAGSVLLTLLEAAAANDFENSTAILNILELLDIDAIANNDLDSRAADFGLTRNTAVKASGTVSIIDSSITKQSTGLYVIQPAPISGQNVLYVNNTVGWASTGTLFIGRGTANFEGPIPYTSITVFPTYSLIALGSALQNNHLISETVINSQGKPDRSINAGTVVAIPANDVSPEIQYVTLRSAVLPSGETTVSNVSVIALIAGSQGNAGFNTITSFDSVPFSGATVTNTTAFTNGADIETDTQLRNRIKNYSTTLARGTATSIITAVVGVSDPLDNKQVTSATIIEPVNIGDPSILYIDDGTGFQPSFTGQSVDILLNNANGSEKFLQLSNYPVTRPQIINDGVAPFALSNDSYLRVIVDGVAETVVFTSDEFINISSATLAEVVAAINNTIGISFSASLTNNSQNLILSPIAFDTERFQVAPLLSTDVAALYANTLFQFPTTETSYIALFQNSTRLRSKAINATLETETQGQWAILGPGDLSISVDGTPAQDRSFALSDFVGASSFAALTLANWVTAFNNKFAGITAVATSAQTISISSNKVGSASSLNIVGGTYIQNMFSGVPLSAVGQTSQFELNRQTGNLEILTTIAIGDTISAGVADARGFALSTSTISGTYNVSSDSSGRASTMVVVPDATYAMRRTLGITLGSTIDIQNPSGTVMRIMAPTITMFQPILPGDYVFIAKRTSGWFNPANTGLFRVFEKGGHTSIGVDTYVDVENVNVVAESGIVVQDTADIKAFTTDGYPQIFVGTYTSNPPADTIYDLVNTLNSSLVNVSATVFKTNSIKLTSTTENDGSIAILVSSGPIAGIFAEIDLQVGNPPLIANKVSSKDLISYFKPTAPVSTNIWLNRQTWDDQKGALTANAVQAAFPFTSPYSEQLQSTGKLNASNVDYDDYIFLTRGNNRGQFRTISAFLGSDTVGTQQNLARTTINHTIGDEFEIVEPVRISSTDTMVVVMDQDPTNNTISINMSRTGQVNSGSSAMTFLPTTTEFSANDFDSQTGIDFGNVNVWGTTINNTNFADYAVWMRSHNWYVGGGLSQLGVQGAMIVRSAEYGANGNDIRFALSYPTNPNKASDTTYTSTPSWSLLTYIFGSGVARTLGLNLNTYTFTVTSANATVGATYTNNGQTFTVQSTIVAGTTLVTTGTGAPTSSGTLILSTGTGDATITFSAVASSSSITVTGPYPNSTTNFPAGAASSGNYFDYTFSNGTFGTVQVGDVLSILSSSGVSSMYQGQFRVANVAGTTVRVYSPSASAGTSSISSTVGINIFPLTSNDVASIVSTVNQGAIIELVGVGSTSLKILKATQEEDYTYGGNSTALAYGHNPTNSNLNSFIGLYDGINWTKSFENPNPNFTLKTAYLLQGVAPSIYSMDTAPSFNVATVGELFKLVPISVQNVYHHMTQKAISQLPLVSNVSISDNRKNIQIVSNNLGSSGAVEVVGGNANVVKKLMTVDSEIVIDGSGSYLLTRVPAYPDTFNVGDVVMLGNDKGVQRLSRLEASDTINVTNSSGSSFEYNYNPKSISVTPGTTTFTLTDVSSSYSLSAGVVWRWQASSDIVLTSVNAGDLVFAYGTLSGWSRGNAVRSTVDINGALTGDNNVAGLPIINVNAGSHYFDVVNPIGVAMSTTVVPVGSNVQICPTPVIRWNLAHAARVKITHASSSITAFSNVVTVTTDTPHYLNTNDQVSVEDSLHLPDGTYGGASNLIVTSPTVFTFNFTIANFSEVGSGASILKSTLTPTRYRLEKLNVNGLVRLQQQDGQSPRFADCGVAVDDYIVLSGSTFASNNNGIFRVQAVDNTSLVLTNVVASDQLNTVVNFNNNSLEAVWTANTNTVSGAVGTFKYVAVGDWVKQSTDADSLYLQVLNMSPSTPALATSITLGGNYGGETGIGAGVVYDELNNYDKGFYLQNVDDIAVYEGDATLVGDTFTTQNIANVNWFSPVNIGTFDITQTGTDVTTFKPFIRVTNIAGVVQSNVQMSVSVSGLYITESIANKFYSIRTVSRAAIDSVDENMRAIYLPQWTRPYKFTVANGSSVTHIGKLGYDTNIVIGDDGYTYYTGLLRTVQRVVDGFDPDINTYPGQRAVGGLIETLPPLIHPITLALTVTTNNGVNLSDISNQITSSIISYIEGLNVGQNVVISQIIANLMQITGVASVVFTTPVPSLAVISVTSNQKATISASDIGIS